jgi:hypothetical protein
MSIDNLAKIHFAPNQKQGINDALYQIFDLIKDITVNLTAKERSKYGKVGEQGKLLINKVKDFQEGQPALANPDVDWVEFNNDYADREFAEGVLRKLKSIETQFLSIKILRDHDNKTDALHDYKFAQYKSSLSTAPGYSYKTNELKQFFPKTGKLKKKEI